jgi:hypothetical protein
VSMRAAIAPLLRDCSKRKRTLTVQVRASYQ